MLSKEAIEDELTLAQKILTKWQERLAAGIPGAEIPAADIDIDIFHREMAGELMLVSAKLESLANLLGDG